MEVVGESSPPKSHQAVRDSSREERSFPLEVTKNQLGARMSQEVSKRLVSGL